MPDTQTPPVASSSSAIAGRVTLLISLLLLFVAAYFYFAPVGLQVTNNGGTTTFQCGSPGAAQDNVLARSVCAPFVDAAKLRAALTLGAAVALAAVGAVIFGLVQNLPVRRDAWMADDPDYDRRAERDGRGRTRVAEQDARPAQDPDGWDS